MDACRALEKLGVDLPVGSYSGCPCCWSVGRAVTLNGHKYASRPMQAAMADMCMKLTSLLSAPGLIDDVARPDNARVIIGNVETMHFLR